MERQLYGDLPICGDVINVVLHTVERHLSGREIESLLAVSTKPTITLKIVTIPARSNKDRSRCVWFQSLLQLRTTWHEEQKRANKTWSSEAKGKTDGIQ